MGKRLQALQVREGSHGGKMGPHVCVCGGEGGGEGKVEGRGGEGGGRGGGRRGGEGVEGRGGWRGGEGGGEGKVEDNFFTNKIVYKACTISR